MLSSVPMPYGFPRAIRVAILAEEPGLGGINKYCLDLAGSLKACPDVGIRLFFPCKRNESSVWLVEEAERLGLELDLLPMRWTFDPSIIRRLAYVLKKEQIDIVHSQGYKSSVISHFALGMYRLPAQPLSTAHGLGAFTARQLKWYVPFDLLVKRLFGTPVIAVSKDTKAKLIQRGLKAEKITVVPNGVDIPPVANASDQLLLQRELGLNGDLQTVGFVGRLDPDKSIDFLAAIARKVLSLRSKVQFLVVGDGLLRAKLEELALEFPGRVVLAGARHDMDRIYGLIDILLLPTQASEAMPFALLEAMSHSIPAVVSFTGGTPEVIEDGVNGFLFPRGDKEGMTEKTLDLVRDAALRQRIGQSARARIKSGFTRELMCKRTLEVYKTLVSNVSQGRGWHTS